MCQSSTPRGYRLVTGVGSSNLCCGSRSVSVCLSRSVCLGMSVSVCLSRYVCLGMSVSVCLSVCLPAWLAGCLSVCLPACLPGWLAVCLSVCLSRSVCLSQSVCLSVSVCLYRSSVSLSVSFGQDTRTNTPTPTHDVSNGVSPRLHNRHRERSLIRSHTGFHLQKTESHQSHGHTTFQK